MAREGGSDVSDLDLEEEGEEDVADTELFETPVSSSFPHFHMVLTNLAVQSSRATRRQCRFRD